MTQRDSQNSSWLRDVGSTALKWGVAAGATLFVGRTLGGALFKRRDDEDAESAQVAVAEEAVVEAEAPATSEADENAEAIDEGEGVEDAEADKTAESADGPAEDDAEPGHQESEERAETDLAELTRDELYELAQQEDVHGRGSMNKAELLAALQETDLTELTRDELYELAQQEDIHGRSSMNKAELLAALEEIRDE